MVVLDSHVIHAITKVLQNGLLNHTLHSNMMENNYSVKNAAAFSQIPHGNQT